MRTMTTPTRFCLSVYPRAAFALGCLGLLLHASPVSAASDGSMGASSTGNLQLNVNVPRMVSVTGFSDLNLGEYSGFGDMSATDNVSISMNTQGTYQIAASGSCAGNSPANGFNISDGQALLPYSVYFNDSLGIAGETRLDPSTPLAGRTNANFPVDIESDNATLHVVIREADVRKARAGAYTGQLSISITAE